MSPLIRRTLIALAIIAALAASFWWFSRPKPIAVVASEIDRGTVEASIANTRAGTVEACQRTKLSTIVGGRIEVLDVKEGDRVKKGQLLMKLWNDDQQAQSALAGTEIRAPAQLTRNVRTSLTTRPAASRDCRSEILGVPCASNCDLTVSRPWAS